MALKKARETGAVLLVAMVVVSAVTLLVASFLWQ